MTTKSSPIQVLKAQADKIAQQLKDPKCVLRDKDPFKAGIVMDDKTFILEWTWALVDSFTEEGLAKHILNLMQESDEP